MRHIFFFIAFFSLNQIIFAQNFTGGYPFVLSALDSTTQKFLPQFPVHAITEFDRVTVGADKFMANGQPLRFWGVNIVAAASFPPKEKAPLIAARLRKMGVNLVRFHHLENNWSGDDGCIFLYSQGSRQLNPTTLDRLEFFIAQLKANGIYVNMNLNVSRIFKEQDGVPGADSIPEFAKGVTYFDPWLRFLQNEYAQQLLGHVNPYTGLPLAGDPVLAIVETNNENTLYGFWKEGRLRPFAKGGSLMYRHSVMLDTMWHSFLQNKYGTQDGLANAWGQGSIGGGVGEALTERGFESGTIAPPWYLEVYGTAQASVSSVVTSPHSGTRCGRLQVNAVDGTGWHIQFKQSGFSVKKDSSYVLRFWAKGATAKSGLSITVMRDNDPYTGYASANFSVTTEWQEIVLSFTAPEDNVGSTRISISPEQNTGTFFFDDFSLAKPSKTGLLAGETFLSKNIKRIDWAERQLYTDGRLADMALFYMFLQKRHLDEMLGYLKNELHVKAAITGTNALVGPADAYTHEQMDFLDDHNYWDHPSFPNGWNNYNWTIFNQPMVKSPAFGTIGSTFSGLAFKDKPFTVSEYNHAAPNRFRTEMPHALLAYGSFHGADGFMFFAYNGDISWEQDAVDNFFDLDRDHSIMALFPTCAHAFRQGFLQEEQNPLLVKYRDAGANDLIRSENDWRWSRWTPYDQRLNLEHAIRTETYQAGQNSDFSALPAPNFSGQFTTSTNETTLNTNIGYLKTETPNFCGITGLLQDASNQQAGNLRLLSANGFGSLLWISTGNTPLSSSKRSLLTLSSTHQNTGTVWDGVTTIHDQWGAAPSQLKALKAKVSLQVNADTLRVYTLDTKGKESSNFQTLLPVSTGVFELDIDQTLQKTPWLGIEALGAGISGTGEAMSKDSGLNIFPNPATNESVRIAFRLEKTTPVQLQLFDVQGKMVRTLFVGTLPYGEQRLDIPLSDLPSGNYWVKMNTDNEERTAKLIRQ